jgi:hypothetical protein
MSARADGNGAARERNIAAKSAEPKDIDRALATHTANKRIIISASDHKKGDSGYETVLGKAGKSGKISRYDASLLR